MYRSTLCLLVVVVFCVTDARSVAIAADAPDKVWKTHDVRLQNGQADQIKLPAQLQIVTEPWNRVVAVPFLVYMPEKDRLLLLVNCDGPHEAMVMSSDDHGTTWSELRRLVPGKTLGMGFALCYLEQGKVLAHAGGQRWLSADYGATWDNPVAVDAAPDGKPWNVWDPPFVERDGANGTAKLLVETGYAAVREPGNGPGYQRACLRSSADGGRTWTPGLCPAQWNGVSEVSIVRAANGDWVAACRTDISAALKSETLDHFEGLGVSISKDRGNTWSDVKKLYDWGRHHASLLLMPNHDLVMTYVVRKGYMNTPDGFPQFGVEAVVSHDHGQSWDLDHRYVLHTWAGKRKGANAWWPSSQATSSVLLPDGSILTAFGTGFRLVPEKANPPRDIGLVHWKPGEQPLNEDRTMRDAADDSDLRNVFDPALMLPLPRAFDKQLTGKTLRTIFNNDTNNITSALDPNAATRADYRKVLDVILDRGPGVLEQDVGLPDTVIYPTNVATMVNKYLEGNDAKVVTRLQNAGTDLLQLTLEAAHQRGVPVVASYRMNAEDYYEKTYALSDFGRAHPEWRMSGAIGCLDPAVPEVYEYRIKIFREVAEKYDIDGIGLDFRRWFHMISNPEKNHVILTRMVRDVRKILDEAAARRGRRRLLLGVRVGPSLDTSPNPFVYPGELYPTDPQNSSCRAYGLDVKTWIQEGLVDYVCPATFIGPLPGLPRTRKFVDLTAGRDIGVYPTLWQASGWMHGVSERYVTLAPEDEKARALFKYDLCTTALQMYRDGAAGVSTFNWFSHLRDANVFHNWIDRKNDGGKVDGSFTAEGSDAIQTYIYPLLGDSKAIETYLRQPWALPPSP